MNTLFLLLLTMFQAAPTPSGVWDGAIALPGQELAFSTTLTRTGETWAGTFDIPAQGAKGIPLGALTVSAADISFSIPGAGQPTIKMTISPDGKSMSGALTQGGGSFPVKLAWKGDAKVTATPEVVDGAKLEGIWQGTIPVGGNPIRLVLRVTKTANGGISATFGSPDQSSTELPVTGIAFKNSALEFSVAAIGGSYKGTLSADGMTITGTLMQGVSMPLTLKKT